MSVKTDLLKLLTEKTGSHVSGEEIAGNLGVSRTAIWKAIKSLKEEGYNISATTNKGYCLSPSDVISKESIEKYLEHKDIRLEVFSTIDSTNLYLKKKASQEGAAFCPEGLCAVSNRQEQGRGRLGRSFYSPQDSGAYFSILLRPPMFDAKRASNITTMAAVAVCEAIETISDKSPMIKWVNDVFLDGKKICGILTEASFDLESGLCDYAVLGIGINVYYPDDGFPEEIEDIAGGIFESKIECAKSKLVAYTINRFLHYYRSVDKNEYIAAYKKRCFVLGREIYVVTPNSKRKATAIDLDSECHLVVRYTDGTIDTLSSGEISIRL